MPAVFGQDCQTFPVLFSDVPFDSNQNAEVAQLTDVFCKVNQGGPIDKEQFVRLVKQLQPERMISAQDDLPFGGGTPETVELDDFLGFMTGIPRTLPLQLPKPPPSPPVIASTKNPMGPPRPLLALLPVGRTTVEGALPLVDVPPGPPAELRPCVCYTCLMTKEEEHLRWVEKMREDLVPVDGDTFLPRELFNDMLRLGKEAKSSGVHRYDPDDDESEVLIRGDILDRKSQAAKRFLLALEEKRKKKAAALLETEEKISLSWSLSPTSAPPPQLEVLSAATSAPPLSESDLADETEEEEGWLSWPSCVSQ